MDIKMLDMNVLFQNIHCSEYISCIGSIKPEGKHLPHPPGTPSGIKLLHKLLRAKEEAGMYTRMLVWWQKVLKSLPTPQLHTPLFY